MQVTSPRFGLTYVFKGKKAKAAAQHVKRTWDAEGRKGSPVTQTKYRGEKAYTLSTRSRFPFREWNYNEWFPVVDVLKRFNPVIKHVKDRRNPLTRFLRTLIHRPVNKEGYYLVTVNGRPAKVKTPTGANV